MPHAFSEPPIPPFTVAVATKDGVVTGYVNMPQAWGTRQQCGQFIAEHRPPLGLCFDVVHIDTGRPVSYVVPGFTGYQRRLTLQDTSAFR